MGKPSARTIGRLSFVEKASASDRNGSSADFNYNRKAAVQAAAMAAEGAVCTLPWQANAVGKAAWAGHLCGNYTNRNDHCRIFPRAVRNFTKNSIQASAYPVAPLSGYKLRRQVSSIVLHHLP